MDFLLFGCLETFLPFGTYEFSQNLRGFLSNSPLNTKQRRNIAQLAPKFTQADMYIISIHRLYNINEKHT